MSAARLTPAVIVVLTAVLGARLQLSPTAPAAGGRLSGQVATSYGALVADATVTLTSINQTGARVGPRSTQSGRKGEFTFEQLPAGQYRLSASKAGFTSRQPLEDGVREDVSSFRFGTGPEVVLGDEQHVAGVGVVVYRSAGIAGRIIRPDGSAAEGVEVSAARRMASGRAISLIETSTNSAWDGRYEITDLPPGEYAVAARLGLRLVNEPPRSTSSPSTATGAVGLRKIDPSEAFRITMYPGVPDTEPGELVTLFEGVRAEGIDIWLTPAQRFSVSGRVFWPVGVAPGPITIDFGDPAGTRSGLWYVSDPGGLFTLMGIPPGPLTVLARAESDQGPLLGLATTIVAVDSVEDVRVVVDRPGRVSGRVVYEGGAPANRATSIALVQKLLKVSALYPVPEAPLGRDARFEIAEALGEYEFELRGLPSGLTITRILRGGVALRANRIAVAGGEIVEDLEVVVGPR